MENTPTPVPTEPQSRPSTARLLLILLAAVLTTGVIAVGGTVWWVKHHFDPKPMKPVVLTAQEQAALESKLAVFGDPPLAPVTVQVPAGQGQPPASPVPVPEAAPGAEHRTLIFTEREVNAYFARQNLGENVQISFAEGKVVAGIIVEAPPDFPFFAGQKVRLRMTFGTGFSPEQKMSFIFDDLSVGGISLPNAWLGDLKGVDLVQKNLESDPALQRFLRGIESIELHRGSAKVVLRP